MWPGLGSQCNRQAGQGALISGKMLRELLRLTSQLRNITHMLWFELELVCSAIDKLDKEPWEAVRAEMVDQKGLPAKAADAIGRYVRDDVEPKFQGRPEEVRACHKPGTCAYDC